MLPTLLWLLGANVGLRLLESRGFKVVAYANNVVILVDGKFLSTMGDLIYLAIVILPSWAINWV